MSAGGAIAPWLFALLAFALLAGSAYVCHRLKRPAPYDALDDSAHVLWLLEYLKEDIEDDNPDAQAAIDELDRLALRGDA